MENPPPKKILSNWDFFVWNWEKNPYFFGIGNGAEFRPQNQVIESPEVSMGYACQPLEDNALVHEQGRGSKHEKSNL